MTDVARRAVETWLSPATPRYDFPIPPEGARRGSAAIAYRPFSEVWVYLNSPVRNAFTGEFSVWAEATVIDSEPDGQLLIVTERHSVKGYASPFSVMPRLSGEIAPGRKHIGDVRP